MKNIRLYMTHYWIENNSRDEGAFPCIGICDAETGEKLQHKAIALFLGGSGGDYAIVIEEYIAEDGELVTGDYVASIVGVVTEAWVRDGLQPEAA